MEMITMLTQHIQFDRSERATAILTHMSLGTAVCEDVRRDEYGRLAREVLTDTGVVLIYNLDGVLVTMYLATVRRATAIHKGELPYKLFNLIRKNEKRFDWIYKMK